MYNEMLKELRIAKNNSIIAKELLEGKIKFYESEIERIETKMKEHENDIIMYSFFADASLSAYRIKNELSEILKYVAKVEKAL